MRNVPAHFTVGLADGNDMPTATAALNSAFRDLTISKEEA
jgi:hypothetical protein